MDLQPINSIDIVNKEQKAFQYDFFGFYDFFRPYYFIEYNGEFHFVFTEIKEINLLAETGPTDLVSVKITKNGQQKRTVLKTYPKKYKQEPLMRNGSGFMLSDNELIFATMNFNSKYYGFSKLTIK